MERAQYTGQQIFGQIPVISLTPMPHSKHQPSLRDPGHTSGVYESLRLAHGVPEQDSAEDHKSVLVRTPDNCNTRTRTQEIQDIK